MGGTTYCTVTHCENFMTTWCAKYVVASLCLSIITEMHSTLQLSSRASSSSTSMYSQPNAAPGAIYVMQMSTSCLGRHTDKWIGLVRLQYCRFHARFRNIVHTGIYVLCAHTRKSKR